MKKTFKSLRFCNISKFNNGFIWNPSQVQSFWTNCVFPLKSFFAKFTTFFNKLIWAMLVRFNSGKPGKLSFCYSIAYLLSCTELKIDWNYFFPSFLFQLFSFSLFVLCFFVFFVFVLFYFFTFSVIQLFTCFCSYGIINRIEAYYFWNFFSKHNIDCWISLMPLQISPT